MSTVDGSKASFCDMEGRESELSDLDFRLMESAMEVAITPLVGRVSRGLCS